MNPLLADALVGSRGGIARPPFDGELTPPQPGSVDLEAPFAKWEPLIRYHTCMLELLSGLHFRKGNKEATLLHIGHKPDAVDPTKGTYQSYPVVRMLRPDEAVFRRQLPHLFTWSELRRDRASEILVQLAPQTPFWSAVSNLQPTRNKYTYELIELVLGLASTAAMRFKHAFDCTRPVAYSAKLQPMIPTPEHSSLPSGHATEAYAVAHLLRALHPEGDAVFRQLEPLAGRIAINRTVAGMHFPIDSMAGRILGKAMAEYLVYRCTALARNDAAQNRPSWQGLKFEVKAGEEDADFDPTSVPLQSAQNEGAAADPAKDGDTLGTLLPWMWQQAQAEWP